MFSRRDAERQVELAQAIAAAPAPEKTIFTSSIFLPATSSAFSSAAAEMIAVPCWSSWKTGIFISLFSRSSISKHSGAVDVLEVDAAERRLETARPCDELLGVARVDLDVEDVDVGEALEEDALPFHHRLAGERRRCCRARAPRCRWR